MRLLPGLFISLFILQSYASNSVVDGKLERLAKNQWPNYEVDAGTFYNNKSQTTNILFKNPFGFPLMIKEVERVEKGPYSFSPDYLYGRSISAGGAFNFEFSKRSYWSGYEKRSGKCSDRYSVHFSNATRGEFYCLMTIHYELIRNQTWLEIKRVDSINLGIADTLEVKMDITNTGKKPVEITKIAWDNGLISDITLPMVIEPGVTYDLPIKLHRGGAYGMFTKRIEITTTEEIERPEAYGYVSGVIIGEPQPRITFDTLVQRRDNIDFYGDGRFTFWFTNTGELPLIVNYVKSSCGCLVPNYSRTPVLPGERGKVEARYDTKRVGPFNKSLSVKTNASGAYIVLRIKGSVKQRSANEGGPNSR